MSKGRRIALSLMRMDLVSLDELGYFTFSQAGGALLFHLLYEMYEHTGVITTTNLSFAELSSVFIDAKMNWQPALAQYRIGRVSRYSICADRLSSVMQMILNPVCGCASGKLNLYVGLRVFAGQGTSLSK